MGTTLLLIIFQTLLISFGRAALPKSNVAFLTLVPPFSEQLEHDSPIQWYAGAKNIERIAEYLSIEFHTYPLEGDGEYGLTADLVAYFIHHYFASTWGWELLGLGRFGNLRDIPEIQEISLLAQSLPDLTTSLQRAAIDGKRLSLNEVATVIATIERLLLDEFLPRFVDSFSWYGTNPWQPQPRQIMADILLLFLAQYHSSFATGKPKSARYFVEDFIQRYDVVNSQNVNPFVPKMYNPQEVFELFRIALESYTKLQQRGCVRMHDDLKRYVLPDRTLPVSASLTPGMHEEGFEFSESIEYLEATGAMQPYSARVWLPNYMAGPSNCDFHLRHVLTCCTSLCTPIVRGIAAAVRGPEVAPETLLKIMSNVSSRYVDLTTDRLDSKLVQRIHRVAQEHGGKVQIHSRSFDQWLHAVFPEECSYPSLTKKDQFVGSSRIWWKQVERAEKAKHEQAKAMRFESMKDSEIEQEWHQHEVFYAKRQSTTLQNVVAKFAMFLGLVAAARVAIELGGSSYFRGTLSSSKRLLRQPRGHSQTRDLVSELRHAP